jgi:GNAT superfamily N-acetyltransferase
MVIREAGREDDDAIWTILSPVFRAGETYAQPRDIGREAALGYWTAPAHSVFVDEREGIVGTYYLKANALGGGVHVANAAFATAEAARGQGVARAMLEHALDTARERGFAAMQFNYVIASNTGALKLWLSAGFAEVGRVPAAFRHPRLGPTDVLILHRGL